MEKYILANDIRVFYVTATSFPEGILKAYQTLHGLLPDTAGRKFYGISRPEGKGKIIYKAAVEESYPGEAEKLGCEIFVIRKGTFISEVLTGWRDNEAIVGQTFQKLIAYPEVDPAGYCVEIYTGENEMRCMVPLEK